MAKLSTLQSQDIIVEKLQTAYNKLLINNSSHSVTQVLYFNISSQHSQEHWTSSYH